MKEILYNVASTQPCEIGYSGDHKKTKIVFQGFEVQNSTNEVYLKFKGRSAATSYLIPITNLEIVITSTLTAHAGEFSCQLEERKADGTFVSQSGVFKLKIHQSIKANSDYEVTDDRLETIYTQYNALYQDLVAKRDNGFFKGPKGDTGNTGPTGTNGQDGYSPTATVSKVGTTSTITITDKNGTTTASVVDGETPDLTDYVKNTDYATRTKGGVIKLHDYYGALLSTSNILFAEKSSYNTYSQKDDNYFIGKGTLDNVLANKTVSDVKINGTSAKVDGVAEIKTSTGLGANTSGIYVADMTDYYIGIRAYNTPITAKKMDYAIKLALTDGVGQAYTDTEKANARKRIGLEYELLVNTTCDEAVNNFVIDLPRNCKHVSFAWYNPNGGSTTIYGTAKFGVLCNDNFVREYSGTYAPTVRNGARTWGTCDFELRGTRPFAFGMSGDTDPLTNGWGSSFNGRMFDFSNNLSLIGESSVITKVVLSNAPSGLQVKVWGC